MVINPRVIRTQTQHHQVLQSSAARPRRAAPAAPANAVGMAAAAFPLPVDPAVADETADEAEDWTELALLVALLKALPAALEALLKTELAAAVREAREDEAAELPVAAAELRLAMLLESAPVAESKLEATEDWASEREDDAAAADSEAAEVMEETAELAEAAADPDPEADAAAELAAPEAEDATDDATEEAEAKAPVASAGRVLVC